MRQGLWDRRLEGRGEERRPPITRFGGGGASGTRSVHAPAHIEQARSVETGARRGLPGVALVLAGSFAAGLGGGGSVAEAAAAWLSGSAPHVEAIAVRGAEQLSASDVSAATGVPRGIDLRGVDASAVAAQLARHPWIASARAVELPTGRLLVEVVERHAVATVSARDAKQLFAVDANGTAVRAAPRRRDSRAAASRAERIRRDRGAQPGARRRRWSSRGRSQPLGLPRPLEIEVAASGGSGRLLAAPGGLRAARPARPRRPRRAAARARARARARASGSRRSRHARSSLRRPGGAARDAVLERGGRRDGAARRCSPVRVRRVRRTRRPETGGVRS